MYHSCESFHYDAIDMHKSSDESHLWRDIKAPFLLGGLVDLVYGIAKNLPVHVYVCVKERDCVCEKE